MKDKVYLGDGVYCQFDGNGFVLTTENGVETTNTIYLEGEVATALFEHLNKVREAVQNWHAQIRRQQDEGA